MIEAAPLLAFLLIAGGTFALPVAAGLDAFDTAWAIWNATILAVLGFLMPVWSLAIACWWLAILPGWSLLGYGCGALRTVAPLRAQLIRQMAVITWATLFLV